MKYEWSQSIPHSPTFNQKEKESLKYKELPSKFHYIFLELNLVYGGKPLHYYDFFLAKNSINKVLECSNLLSICIINVKEKEF